MTRLMLDIELTSLIMDILIKTFIRLCLLTLHLTVMFRRHSKQKQSNQHHVIQIAFLFLVGSIC